ncbi:ABC transporter permease [Nocardia stercoris]|uniref:Antibiotic transporter n=1 Tax=Nocardia stercoris TaxID=2483361 RepID=A0A3M2L3F8_9NOCA|nr:ABC transporter permease [Nocardia stercoris]RMI31924.1 antibiotic transporter [Nocardia stercoris]
MTVTAAPTAQQLFENMPVARPNKIAQWWALTGRLVRTAASSGDLLIVVGATFIFTIGYWLPLRFVMSFQGINFAQFVMPIIVLQTMSFTMMSNAQIAATEAMTGLNLRMQSMPVGGFVPLAARMSGGFVRAIVAMISSIAFGYWIGFRFIAGPAQAVGFVLFAFAVGFVLAIGADALGSLSKSPEALSQALSLPTLIFGMLSCGFVPEKGFPHWIRPFVRNQPVSQFSFALRDMAGTGVTWHVLWVPLVWLGGMGIVFIPLAIWASTRRS